MSSDQRSQQAASNEDAYRTSNYPPPGDTTASGGYGSQATWSSAVQRGRTDIADSPARSQTGLIDQSVNGGPIGQELQDATQGEDGHARSQFRHDAQRDFSRQNSQALNPYGRNVDTSDDARDMLASAYSDARATKYESSAATTNDDDVGAS